jgi:hypothetical protein
MDARYVILRPEPVHRRYITLREGAVVGRVSGEQGFGIHIKEVTELAAKINPETCKTLASSLKPPIAATKPAPVRHMPD